jgi:2-oxoisovalerate dehydrogenase E1 component
MDDVRERSSEHLFDWRRIAETFILSRALDDLEERSLLENREQIKYQFSAKGHELGQIILGTLLTEKRDAVGAYYRSRPLLLTLGVSVLDALRGSLGKDGSATNGRESGVIFNLPSKNGPTVLPMAGGVGTQYAVSAGWAQGIRYHTATLHDLTYSRAISVAIGGDGSVASNGFWAALNIASTRELPMLFVIEDNGFAISVPSTLQTPGGNIARNLASFQGIRILEADTSDPPQTAQVIYEAVRDVRARKGPALIRLTMPRLSGHSGFDSQEYKGAEMIVRDHLRDPLLSLQTYLVPDKISYDEWEALERNATNSVARALNEAMASAEPTANRSAVCRHLYADDEPISEPSVHLDPPRDRKINMLKAIRRTLDCELRTDRRILLFGEDVGVKGGVHGATRGLQSDFGSDRVFDTSLSEEGIVGSAVGLALAGLRPVAEIQFRKYADSAIEQLNDCGSMRWRTNNRFSAPIVVRMPAGYSQGCGEPFHSVSSEATFAHALGWQVLYPSNAEDATGLLRAAMRSNNPSIFLEHRAQLYSQWASRPYPGDSFMLPIGTARIIQTGTHITLVTWGGMVERSLAAAELSGVSVEIIDLRTILPWDKEAVIGSVYRTGRCIIVHEDNVTAGFGAEIATIIARECFLQLEAPIERLAVPDVPLPYNSALLEAIIPTPVSIAQQIVATALF